MSLFAQYLPSDSWKTFALGTFCLALLYGISKLLRLAIGPLFSQLRDLPGPRSPSLIFGHFKQVVKASPGELHAKWIKEYGPTLVCKGLFNRYRILTADTKALSHILNHSYEYQKSQDIRRGPAQILGEGVLFAEGDSHKRQRRIMNPSFSLSHLRELNSIFLEKSAQLRDIWLVQAAEHGGSHRTDVLSWLSKATLDVIGLAGFDYEFNALNSTGEENELSNAFMTIFKEGTGFTILGILQVLIPLFRLIPTERSRHIARAKKVMRRIGLQLVEDKKRAIISVARDSNSKGILGIKQIEKSSIPTRDLLSRLMAANMATDLPANQRLSDEDVFAQIPTFLVAGHETTSTSTTWCLYALCRDLAIQNKLRDELLTLSTSTPTMDELNSLPYLDAVVRETLRLHAPVTASMRVATKDDIVPLGTPFKDRKGRLKHELRVKKGDTILIPILLINTYTEIWGEDANEFRPERWQHLPEKVNDIPGVSSGILSFLGGPRNCIGYRFALLEMKCLLWTLVRAFSFELADPSYEIIKKSNIVARPVVKSEPDVGSQMPLRLTPWRGA